MERNVSRILIETVVKKTLKDIDDSPQRSIRNLVDMALHFSNGRFRRNFFEAAQTMLKNENSSYYGLVEDTVHNVDQKKLLQFGMNLGYNGCTEGAKTIREIEAKENYNIPWTISLYLEPDTFFENRQKYQERITQGEKMGIHTWALIPAEQATIFLPLVKEHTDSAFILFCRPREITPSFLDSAAQYDNLMLAVCYEKGATAACELLRRKKLLYSTYLFYTDADERKIISGELLLSTQQLHPVFTILISKMGYSGETRENIYEEIKQMRKEQRFRTVPWEIFYDSNYIDGIISNESCSAGFDANGHLYTCQGKRNKECFCLFQNDLSQILKRAFPKSNTEKMMA